MGVLCKDTPSLDLQYRSHDSGWSADGNSGPGFYGFTDYLTALFPTLFGIILMMAGAVSVSRPELNALAMHFATGFGCGDSRIYNGPVRDLDYHYITD